MRIGRCLLRRWPARTTFPTTTSTGRTITILRLAYAGLLAGALTGACRPPATGQQTTPGPDSRRPEQLDAEAAKAFAAGTVAQCLKAADLWRLAGDRYTVDGRTAEGAAALRNAGRAMACAGDSEAALGYYGRAAELDDAAGSHQLLALLDGSPLYDSTSRGVAEDARFVGAVNQLLAKLSPGQAVSVTSAEDAQQVLEDLAARRLAPITVKAASGPVDVELRRWFYSMTQPDALWERVTTDTTIQRPPAAYHFRYRVRTTGRDTTVMNRCADGCTIVVH